MEGGQASPLSARVERRLAALAIAAGVLLRLVPALDSSYWYDEIFTVAISARPWGEIAAITRADVHPPLYYWTVHALMGAGRALGGPFVSLAWLRVSSLLPGMAIVLICWRLARREWGAGAGLLVLAALALSPPLAFFSVELRNYSLAMAALLAAFGALLRSVDAEPRVAWGWTFGYSASALVALYASNLSALYLVSHVAIYLIALARLKESRKRLTAIGSVAACLISAGYAPWIKALMEQGARLREMELPWLQPARWSDLLSTFFFYLPCGPLEEIDPFGGFYLVAFVAGVAGIAFVAARFFTQNVSLKSRGATLSKSGLLIFAAAISCAIPIGIAFIDSRAGIAKVFLPTRYNMMAAPYFCLAIAGMIVALKPRRLVAWAAGAFLLWSLGWSIYGQALRAVERDDRRFLWPVLEKLGFDARDHVVQWTDPRVSPWLGLGDFTGPATPLRKFWFASHWAAWLNPAADGDAARAFECALEALGERHESSSKEAWMWGGIWSVPAERFNEISRRSERTLAAIRRARAEFKGTQLILPIHRNLQLNPGFGPPESNAEGEVFCQTHGDSQVVAWEGPDLVGSYRVRAVFRRSSPADPSEPEPTLTYDFSGEGEWRQSPAPLGEFAVEGIVRVDRPRQQLLAGFQVNTELQLLRIEVWLERSGGPSPGG